MIIADDDCWWDIKINKKLLCLVGNPRQCHEILKLLYFLCYLSKNTKLRYLCLIHLTKMIVVSNKHFTVKHWLSSIMHHLYFDENMNIKKNCGRKQNGQEKLPDNIKTIIWHSARQQQKFFRQSFKKSE